MEQALTGRAAWGVLGSAAGGHVFVLETWTRLRDRSFGQICGNSANWGPRLARSDWGRSLPNSAI